MERLSRLQIPCQVKHKTQNQRDSECFAPTYNRFEMSFEKKHDKIRLWHICEKIQKFAATLVDK